MVQDINNGNENMWFQYFLLNAGECFIIRNIIIKKNLIFILLHSKVCHEKAALH